MRQGFQSLIFQCEEYEPRQISALVSLVFWGGVAVALSLLCPECCTLGSFLELPSILGATKDSQYPHAIRFQPTGYLIGTDGMLLCMPSLLFSSAIWINNLKSSFRSPYSSFAINPGWPRVSLKLGSICTQSIGKRFNLLIDMAPGLGKISFHIVIVHKKKSLGLQRVGCFFDNLLLFSCVCQFVETIPG